KESGRSLHEGRAAAGGRHADAAAVRAHAVGDDRPAGAHVPVQHGEKPFRAQRDGEDSRFLDARPGSERLDAWPRYGKPRRADKLPGAVAGAGSRVTEQFARGSYTLAADHSSPDRSRP